jgi:hypothetical protein
MGYTYEIIEIETLSGLQKIIKRSDNAFIPMDEANSDYQAYLKRDETEQSTPNPTI